MWDENHKPVWPVAHQRIVGLLICMLFASTAHAGGGPENVIVAVNQNSPASLAVANLYVQLRQIPSRNVIYLDLPFAADQEQITLSEFRDLILTPIFEQIRIRGLESQIDYIVYSADFPTAISIDDAVAQLTKELPNLSDEQTQLMRPMASINALTYFAGAVMGDDNGFLGLDANWYMRLPIDAAIGAPFQGDDDRDFRTALVNIHAGEFEHALQILDPLAQANPMQFATRLQIVRCEAGLGHADETAGALVDLARTGWSHRSTITSMPEFGKVASSDAVKKILAIIPDDEPSFVATHAFRHQYIWGRNGGLNSDPSQGRMYVLSTVLAVTRNNGTTLADALKYLRLSVQADNTHPKGTFYFTSNGDVRTKTRQPGFDAAIAGLKQLGYTASITKERVPANRGDVVGAILGDKSAPWAPSLSEIIPGAIVDNLTSFGGRMKGNHHTLATEYLTSGAAGSSGAVIEPFAVQAKFAHPMIMVHYARGCTMAEAYYQSVHGPFQLLIVGDALCQPWANPIPFQVNGLESGATVRGLVRMQVESAELSRIDHLELYLDGIRSSMLPRSNKFSFDTDTFAEGYHELRVVAVGKGTLEPQSRQIIPFFIDRGGEWLRVTVDQSEVTRDGTLEVTVTAPTQGDITILQNSRPVAAPVKSGEMVRIPAALLGDGTSRLIATAKVQDQTVYSEPVTVTVE